MTALSVFLYWTLSIESTTSTDQDLRFSFLGQASGGFHCIYLPHALPTTCMFPIPYNLDCSLRICDSRSMCIPPCENGPCKETEEWRDEGKATRQAHEERGIKQSSESQWTREQVKKRCFNFKINFPPIRSWMKSFHAT